MDTILVVGENPSLLETRALVLEKTGAPAVYCSALGLRGRITESSASLVVLCHTLKVDQRAAIVDLVRRRWPLARVLQVCELPDDERHDLRVDAWAFGGEPATLVRRAKELMGRSVP